MTAEEYSAHIANLQHAGRDKSYSNALLVAGQNVLLQIKQRLKREVQNDKSIVDVEQGQPAKDKSSFAYGYKTAAVVNAPTINRQMINDYAADAKGNEVVMGISGNASARQFEELDSMQQDAFHATSQETDDYAKQVSDKFGQITINTLTGNDAATTTN